MKQQRSVLTTAATDTDSPRATGESARLDDRELQAHLLPGVSRTFALTIPQLPAALSTLVTNAYLLCRIADTIEDEVALNSDEKQRFLGWFGEVVAAQAPAEPFVRALHPRLSNNTLAAERELVLQVPAVLRVTRQFSHRQQQAVQRCITLMCEGMPRFQQHKSLAGLDDMAAMDAYCYYVAGVVGEMLTELFCDYSAQIERQRTALMGLAVGFGQGLQMTNILKDIWEDRRDGSCWLPRDLFLANGCDLARMKAGHAHPGFQAGLDQLIGVARHHLHQALAYTELIPSHETGIRRFCLWAIGLAVLTLRHIHHNPAFNAGQQVKVSHGELRAVILTCNLAARSNTTLEFLFHWITRELPHTAVADQRNEQRNAG